MLILVTKVLKMMSTSTKIRETLDMKLIRRIRVLQHSFYIAFVILWFKDNFAPLRSFPVHYLFALIPLAGADPLALVPPDTKLQVLSPSQVVQRNGGSPGFARPDSSPPPPLSRLALRAYDQR